MDSWPPAYAPPGGANESRASGYPPAYLPSRGQLEYTRELIVVSLLVLALPWLVQNLLTRPEAVLSGLGRRAMGKAGV